MIEGRGFRIFEFDAKQTLSPVTRLSSFSFNSDVGGIESWCWFNSETLAVMTETALYHYLPSRPDCPPIAMYGRGDGRVQTVVAFRGTPDAKWVALAPHGDEQKASVPVQVFH